MSILLYIELFKKKIKKEKEKYVGGEIRKI
jgi:hypothetical protein